MRLSDFSARARHAERSMPNPLDGGQGIGEPLNIIGLAPCSDDLQAIPVIQVDVLG